MRELTLDVYLRCGDRVEAAIGEVTVPMIVTAGRAEGDVLPFSIAADMPAFRRNLAALLREAADTIEQYEAGDH